MESRYESREINSLLIHTSNEENYISFHICFFIKIVLFSDSAYTDISTCARVELRLAIGIHRMKVGNGFAPQGLLQTNTGSLVPNVLLNL